jgi:hypothetical protein
MSTCRNAFDNFHSVRFDHEDDEGTGEGYTDNFTGLTKILIVTISLQRLKQYDALSFLTVICGTFDELYVREPITRTSRL